MKKRIDWKNLWEGIETLFLLAVLMGGIGFVIVDKVLGFIVKLRLLF